MDTRSQLAVLDFNSDRKLPQAKTKEGSRKIQSWLFKNSKTVVK